jgi:hypothetical protein
MIRHRVGEYGSTYKWIWEPGQTHRFYEWLKSDQSLYWISGKPGSGKSSLLDYIVEQLTPNTCGRNILEQWASPTPLYILTFFVYKPAADSLLKIYEGLWRSMCFQLLHGNAALLDTCLTDSDAPEAIGKYSRVDMNSKLHWMVHELKALFSYLIAKLSGKTFILLDGLDEFDEDHLSLLETIGSLASMPSVKICCAGRPDNLSLRDSWTRQCCSFSI